MISIIVAAAENGVIGRDNGLPWHLPDDLRRFKALSLGKPVAMGRRTFESIGRPLPGRRSIVVSTTLPDPAPAGVERARSLEEALEMTEGAGGAVFVIGGAALYAAALPRARVVHLTELDEPVEGDVVFPPFDRSAWRCVSDVPHPRDDRHAFAFRFRRYERA